MNQGFFKRARERDQANPPPHTHTRRLDGSTAFYQGFTESPYLNDTHREYRKRMRTWVYEKIVATGLGEDLESSGDRVPDELFAEMGRLGILAARLGKGEHLEVWRDEVAPRDQGEAARKIMGVVDVDEFDYFHEAITHEELGRCAVSSKS